MIQAVAGIDIGGTNTVFGLVDKSGTILIETSFETKLFEKAEQCVEKIYQEVERMRIEVAKDVELTGIGIGAPNGNYYKGTIEFAPNLEWKGIIRITEMFRNHFRIPVVLTNDANAAAIGEMLYGGAKGMKNFAVITLGTGLGSGIVVNGKIVNGHNGFAGELGHISVVEQGRECSCGRQGCLETYVSATGIVKTAKELLFSDSSSGILREEKDITAKSISKAALSGDKLALQIFSYTGELLGKSLANLVSLLNPEAIFLFGGLALSGDLILAPAKRSMEDNLLKIFRNTVKLLPSELINKNAAILGAAALMWEELSADD